MPEQVLRTIRTRDEAEAAMAVMAAITVQLQREVALQNSEMLAARVRDTAIRGFHEKLGQYEKGLRAWAEENRGQFGDSKTLELRQGKIGFKLNPRAVNFLDGWTEAKVIAKFRLERSLIFRQCLRIKFELNKRHILDQSKPETTAGKLPEKTLLRFGIKIMQSESFFADPKIEEATAPAAAAAE